MRKKTSLKRPYPLINNIFAGIILAIFLYSLAFSPTRANHPIHSGQGWITQQSSESTGLSRSFSAIVRFDFEGAREFNRHGIRIFIFFLVQLALRFTVMFLLHRLGERDIRVLSLADACQASIMFLVFFFPFFAALAGKLARLS